jgi:hypothetical protein
MLSDAIGVPRTFVVIAAVVLLVLPLTLGLRPALRALRSARAGTRGAAARGTLLLLGAAPDRGWQVTPLSTRRDGSVNIVP